MLNEASPDPGGLPRAPIKTVLMFGFVFILIQGIAELFRTIEELLGTERRGDLLEPALAGGQSASVEDFDLKHSIIDEDLLAAADGDVADSEATSNDTAVDVEAETDGSDTASNETVDNEVTADEGEPEIT